MSRRRRAAEESDLDLLGSAPTATQSGSHSRRGQVLLTGGLAVLAVVGAASGPDIVANVRGHAAPAGIAAAPAAALVALRARAATEPKCPETGSTFPTAEGKGSYAVQIKADINNLQFFAGWSEFGQGWETRAYGITAHTCGLLQIPSLAVSIAPEGIVFDTSKEVFTAGSFLPNGKYNPGYGPGLPGSEASFTIEPKGTSVTSLTGVNPGGSVAVTAATTATAHILSDPTNAGVHFDCPTTTSVTLTTGTSYKLPTGRGPKGPVQEGTNLPPWTVQGEPLNGPLQGATAKVVANDFPVPIFNQDFTDPKNTCGVYAGSFNGFAGGTDEQNQAYFMDFQATPSDHVVQPPGDTWVTGDLVVTEIDPKALQTGPPDTVPGTGEQTR